MKTGLNLIVSVLATSFVCMALTASVRAEETAASVKSYLLEKLEKMTAACEDLVENSDAYSGLVAQHGGLRPSPKCS
jgi:hypothetical protein